LSDMTDITDTIERFSSTAGRSREPSEQFRIPRASWGREL